MVRVERGCGDFGVMQVGPVLTAEEAEAMYQKMVQIIVVSRPERAGDAKDLPRESRSQSPRSWVGARDL